MKSFKRFAAQHPYLFMLVIFPFIPYLLIMIQLGVARLSGFATLDLGSFQDSTKVLSVLTYLLILWQFDWLRPAGFRTLGKWRAWLVMGAASIFELALTIYVLNGHFAWRNLTVLADCLPRTDSLCAPACVGGQTFWDAEKRPGIVPAFWPEPPGNGHDRKHPSRSDLSSHFYGHFRDFICRPGFVRPEHLACSHRAFSGGCHRV